MDNLTTQNLSISKHITSKIDFLESTLHQTIYNFRDFVTEFEQMHLTTESIKKQIIAQKEKCESKCCVGSEELKKVVETKQNIILSVASTLTKLIDTKDFSILTEVFKILFGESTRLDDKVKEERIKDEINSPINIDALTILTPKTKSQNNMSERSEDLEISKIEGTPTGRQSPIIQSKKLKSSTNTPSKDKKCFQSWMTPPEKNLKMILSYPSPTRSKGCGRLRQQRISFAREKPSSILDLTTTPQFSKGRNSQAEPHLGVIDNDDTIMPSPTSGPVFSPVYKSLLKESPQEFKKPLSLISEVKKKYAIDHKENSPYAVEVIGISKHDPTVDMLKVSPHRSPDRADESMSLLQQFNYMAADGAGKVSPLKQPLAENINAVNISCDIDSSVSILQDIQTRTYLPEDNVKRRECTTFKPLYKEPTVRKKSEKRLLPGWSCEKCQNFYGELYRDDPEMQAKKMEDCSKHRGRNNPARPKTPPGYWDPRWNVPDDTEEFNRRNNAV